MIFDYPAPQPERKHAPDGYADYERYRPWLRDEFLFRCVYCLQRENWGKVTSEFEIDHFQPQSLNPGLRLDYQNLVYACRRCNAVKGAQLIEDPLRLLREGFVRVYPDGLLQPQTPDADRLIRQLDLNSPTMVAWRVTWLRVAELADDDLYRGIAGFPKDLPDLSALSPPSILRRESIEQSWFALRERGLLPSEY